MMARRESLRSRKETPSYNLDTSDDEGPSTSKKPDEPRQKRKLRSSAPTDPCFRKKLRSQSTMKEFAQIPTGNMSQLRTPILKPAIFPPITGRKEPRERTETEPPTISTRRTRALPRKSDERKRKSIQKPPPTEPEKKPETFYIKLSVAGLIKLDANKRAECPFCDFAKNYKDLAHAEKCIQIHANACHKMLCEKDDTGSPVENALVAYLVDSMLKEKPYLHSESSNRRCGVYGSVASSGVKQAVDKGQSKTSVRPAVAQSVIETTSSSGVIVTENVEPMSVEIIEQEAPAEKVVDCQLNQVSISIMDAPAPPAPPVDDFAWMNEISDDEDEEENAPLVGKQQNGNTLDQDSSSDSSDSDTSSSDSESEFEPGNDDDVYKQHI